MVATENAFNTVAESPDDRRRLLRIFLADHLASTTGAVELAKRARRENAGTPIESTLASLEGELRRDRDELTRIARDVGGPGSAPKIGLAWLGEKVGRLKLNGRLLSYSPLARVYELEVLLAFAYQRRMMWLTLARAARRDLPESRVDFQQRVERAEQQRLELEELLLDAAEVAL